MKVLHLIPSLDPGGAPLGALELAACQRSCGIDAELLVIGPHPADELSKSWPVPVEFLDVSWRFGDRNSRRQVILRTSVHLRQSRPEILHSHLLPADYVGALASAESHIPHVSHVRDTQPWLMQRGFQQVVKRWMYRRAFANARTSFVAVSRSAGDYCSKAFRIAADRMHVVLNGIDGRRFPDVPVASGKDAFVIGCAGRMSPEKGHADLLQAFQILYRGHPDCRLLLAGTGGLEASLRQLAESLGVSGGVQFCGLISDMNAWYRSLDVLVVPSHSSEGLARAIMESMYCGIPVVATRVAGSDEAIRHGADGYLVNVNSPSDIAEAISRLLTGTDSWQVVSTNAMQRARAEFTVDRVRREVDVVYGRLLNPVRR